MSGSEAPGTAPARGPGEPERGAAAAHTVQLDLPILLPEIPHEQDPCVDRLIERVEAREGVEGAHVTHPDDDRDPGGGAPSGVAACLCVHYDPDLLALSEITRIVEDAGGAVTDRYAHETLWIRGMDCGDCSLSVEHVLGRQDGVLEASVNYAAEKGRIEYDTEKVDRARIVDLIERMGYTVEEPGARTREAHRGPLGGLGLPLASGVLLAVAFFGEWLFGLPAVYAVPLYVGAYLAGGYEAFRHAVAAARNLEPDIEALMVVAALGAAALGHWAEGGLLLFLFSLGHALEHRAMDKARDAIGELGELTPQVARVRRDGEQVEVPVDQLERGDTVVVRPGERIPVDGEVREGAAAVDEAAITGESAPVTKEPGDGVFAGTVNGEASLAVEVTRLAKDTTIARVQAMVEEAQTQKSPTQRFSERLERRFAPAVLALALAVVLVPPLVAAAGPWGGSLAWLDALALPWRVSLLRSLALLVAASPCALAISTPAAILSGIAQGARSGVLVKGGVHLENLGEVDVVAFDKTGTVTRGEPEVVDVVPTDEVDEDELLALAASAEQRSEHPLAEALVRRADERGLTVRAADALTSHAGKGVVARVDGAEVRVGNLRLFRDEGRAVPEEVQERAAALEAQGKTTVLVQRGEAFLGVIALADRPREEARQAVQALEAMGVERVVLLTGDNERVARAVADEVGVADWRAGLLPEEKVDAVRELREAHGEVAMVGDGVNDAPAMAQATVGVAMGAGGTDVALETADVALMGDRLDRVPYAVDLSRRTRGIIRGNLVVSLGVIAALVPLAVVGLAGIGPAIVVHEGSTLLVVANALRLLGGP